MGVARVVVVRGPGLASLLFPWGITAGGASLLAWAPADPAASVATVAGLSLFAVYGSVRALLVSRRLRRVAELVGGAEYVEPGRLVFGRPVRHRVGRVVAVATSTIRGRFAVSRRLELGPATIGSEVWLVGDAGILVGGGGAYVEAPIAVIDEPGYGEVWVLGVNPPSRWPRARVAYCGDACVEAWVEPFVGGFRAVVEGGRASLYMCVEAGGGEFCRLLSPVTRVGRVAVAMPGGWDIPGAVDGAGVGLVPCGGGAKWFIVLVRGLRAVARAPACG